MTDNAVLAKSLFQSLSVIWHWISHSVSYNSITSSFVITSQRSHQRLVAASPSALDFSFHAAIFAFNPLMLTASSLTVLVKSYRQKHIWKNIWRRNVHQNTTNKSPSNVL